MAAAVTDLETGLQAMLNLKPPGVSGSRITSLTALCVSNIQVIISNYFGSADFGFISQCITCTAPLDVMLMVCPQSESVLIQKIYTHFKKAPGTHKLGVLYVVDSVTRKWLEQAKAQGQTVNSSARDGTYAAGVHRVTELMPVLMNDILQSAPEEHKVRTFLRRHHRTRKQEAISPHTCHRDLLHDTYEAHSLLGVECLCSAYTTWLHRHFLYCGIIPWLSYAIHSVTEIPSHAGKSQTCTVPTHSEQ